LAQCGHPGNDCPQLEIPPATINRIRVSFCNHMTICCHCLDNYVEQLSFYAIDRLYIQGLCIAYNKRVGTYIIYIVAMGLFKTLVSRDLGGRIENAFEIRNPFFIINIV
jgi:hypothetical protein